MADPATIGLAVKAAAAALSDERLRKTIGWIVAAALSPLILVIVLICGLVSGSADHNNAAVDLTFNGGSFSVSVPPEYTAHMRRCAGITPGWRVPKHHAGGHRRVHRGHSDRP